MESLDNLKKSLQAFADAANTAKAQGEAKKEIGPEIAERVKEAFANDDEVVQAWLEAEQENKNPLLKTAKAYVSKGRQVGMAMKQGIFEKTDERSVSTLYDLLKTAKADKAKRDQALSDKQARHNAALLAVHGTQEEVDTFLLNADPMTLATVLNTGLAILAEKDQEETNRLAAEQAARDVTDVKAKISLYAEQFPDLFSEIVDYVNGLARIQKAA